MHERHLGRRAALALIAAAPALAARPARAATPVTVRIGVQPVESAGQTFYGKDLGWFDQAGIDVEITESMVAQNAGANVQKLQRLREAGVQVFMDDFVTGYSGLSQIAHLPLDALKIDRAFVAGMTISAEHMAIVSAIVNLARALRIYVVAEGVETEEQAAQLHALGCDEAQGYLFTRPLPAGEIAKLLSLAH